MIIKTNSEIETIEFARKFADKLAPNEVVLLRGDLGMGKSVFARAVICSLCHDGNMEVPSPTFTLVQTYDGKCGQIWHFDLYRLISPDEIYEIGWEEALSGGVLLVEWAERLAHLTPASYIEVSISGAGKQRQIEVTKYG